MRIQVMSDLHLELHADGGAALVEALDPTGVDVLVLAGDVAVGDELPAALGRLCRRYPAAEIVYVHGNHEHYGQSPRATERRTREVERRHRTSTGSSAVRSRSAASASSARRSGSRTTPRPTRAAGT